jgi:hypothetical protein
VKISNIFFSLPLGCSDKAWASTIIDLIQNDCESFMFNEKKSFFSNSYLIKQLSYYNGKLL